MSRPDKGSFLSPLIVLKDLRLTYSTIHECDIDRHLIPVIREELKGGHNVEY